MSFSLCSTADSRSCSEHSNGHSEPSFGDVLSLQVLGQETLSWEDFHESKSVIQSAGQPAEQHCTMLEAPVIGIYAVAA